VWAGDEMEAAPSRLITLVIGELLRVLREMASATFASRSWSHRTMLLRACSLAYRRPNLIDISARWGHRLREFSASFSLSQLCSSDRRDSRTHTLGIWIIPAPYSVRMVQAGASSTAISFSFGTNGMMAVEDERMRNNYASLSAHILFFFFQSRLPPRRQGRQFNNYGGKASTPFSWPAHEFLGLMVSTGCEAALRSANVAETFQGVESKGSW
jgi:hypothetical protein